MRQALEQWKCCPEENQEVLEAPKGTLIIRNKRQIKNNTPSSHETSSSFGSTKVSVKFFTYTERCSIFTDAMNLLMNGLEVDHIDSLTLSPPPYDLRTGLSSSGSIEEMKAIWSCAVKNVKSGKIKELGVSDLDTKQLKDLYNWSTGVSTSDGGDNSSGTDGDRQIVKPSMNQVNLDVCCTIPPDMKDFATTHDIRLLTHNDPRDFVPSDRLLSLLTDVKFPDETEWHHLWAIRYTIVMTGNGVIQNKGYLLALIRKLS